MKWYNSYYMTLEEGVESIIEEWPDSEIEDNVLRLKAWGDENFEAELELDLDSLEFFYWNSKGERARYRHKGDSENVVLLINLVKRTWFSRMPYACLELYTP